MQRILNIILGLLKGNSPLYITYWIYGVVIAIILNIVTYILQFYYASIFLNNIIIIHSYNVFIILYVCFINIAIWNSAGKYLGHKLWKILARASTVIAISSIIIHVVLADSNLLLKRNLAFLNKSLPVMVNNSIRFDYVMLVDDNLHYNMTFFNISYEDLIKISYQISLELRSQLCKDKSVRALLENDRDMLYHYHTQNDQQVVTIKITKQDCYIGSGNT